MLIINSEALDEPKLINAEDNFQYINSGTKMISLGLVLSAFPRTLGSRDLNFWQGNKSNQHFFCIFSRQFYSDWKLRLDSFLQSMHCFAAVKSSASIGPPHSEINFSQRCGVTRITDLNTLLMSSTLGPLNKILVSANIRHKRDTKLYEWSCIRRRNLHEPSRPFLARAPFKTWLSFILLNYY